MKDRSHYGELVRDVTMTVTPEQAARWLNTRPPAPIMWTRGGATGDKAQRYANMMLAGEWDNAKTTEPIIISADHGFIHGGHHRCKAVTLTGKPQYLRVWFYSKPECWEKVRRERLELECLERAHSGALPSGDVYEVFEQDGRFGIRSGGRVYVQPKHESRYDDVVAQCQAMNSRHINKTE